MNDYDDYDDDDDNIEVDSDDEEVKFVSSQRRFQYTTFDDDDNKDIESYDGKEDAIYGVFAEPRRNYNLVASKPMFVKGTSATSIKVEADDDDNDQQAEHHRDYVAPKPLREEEEEEDEETLKAKEELRKQQEQANQQFYALLSRGKGQKRLRSARPDDIEGPSELDQSTKGLGFSAAREADLGFSSNQDPVGACLGFHSAAAAEDNEPPHTISGMGLGFTPALFGEKPPSTSPVKIDPNLGKWEKHTKGIGLKLLSKMGYKGSGGLGAKLKKGEGEAGISRPVEVVVRPTNLGLGFGNFKEATKLKANQQIEAEIRGEKLPDEKKKLPPSELSSATGMRHENSALPSSVDLLKQQSWRRGAKQISRKRPKRNVVPYTELLEKQQQPAIIDMRGPVPGDDSSGKVAVPLADELLHNTSILLNTYENRLHSTSHFLKTSRQKLQSLQTDLDDIERRKKQNKERSSKMRAVIRTIEKISDLTSDTNFDVTDKVQALVHDLRQQLSSEDRVALQFDHVLVPSLLSPLIHSKLESWDPMYDESEATESIIRSLLGLAFTDGNEEATTERRLSILTREILPKVKAAFQSTKWDPIRHVTRALELYETVLNTVASYSSFEGKSQSLDDSQVFPCENTDSVELREVAMRELMRETIFPKLMRVLSQWKAELDESNTCIKDGLETWLLPWIPHLDHPSIMTQLTSDLRRKVRSALSCLSRGVVEDSYFFPASFETLRPWKVLLRKAAVQDLTGKYITPRLLTTIAGLEIRPDPVEQDWLVIDILKRLYNGELMSALDFVSIIEGEVLARWAHELYSHLCSSDEPSAESLAAFYAAWKHELFGMDSSSSFQLLQCDSVICRLLYSCLVMIIKALDGETDERALLSPPLTSYREVLARRAKEERDRTEDELERLQTKDTVEFRKHVISRRAGGATFRDVVEDFAREHDASFRPRTGGKVATDDGKPIFLFGSVPIYLDTNVIFAQHMSEWKPVSLEQLAVMAREGGKTNQ
jgi:tuftelin-interacting protein 11